MLGQMAVRSVIKYGRFRSIGARVIVPHRSSIRPLSVAVETKLFRSFTINSYRGCATLVANEQLPDNLDENEELMKQLEALDETAASPPSPSSSAQPKPEPATVDISGRKWLLKRLQQAASIVAEHERFNAEEAHAFLSRLAALKSLEKMPPNAIADWLNSIDYSADLVAALPTAENLPLPILSSAVHSLAVLRVDDDLRSYLVDEIQRRILLGEETTSIAVIVLLLSAERRHGLRLTQELSEKLFAKIAENMSVLPANVIVTLLPSIKTVKPDWTEGLVMRLDSLLDQMNTAALVSALDMLAEIGYRDKRILKHISTQIEKMVAEPLTVAQLVTLTSAMARLDFHAVGLMRRVANDIVKRMPEVGERWSKMSSLTASLAKMKFGSEKAWVAIVTWMQENLASASLKSLMMCVSACATCGVYPGAAGRLLAERINPDHVPKAAAWLNMVQSLAIVDALTPKLAESVLQPDFVSHILKETETGKFSGPLTMLFVKQKLLQISATARLETAYAGPLLNAAKLEIDEKADNKLALELKYGKKASLDDARVFREALYKLAPLNSHCLPPAFYGEAGCVLDARLAIGSDGRFLGIDAWPALEPQRTSTSAVLSGSMLKPGRQPQLLAMFYLTYNHLTQAVDETDEQQVLGSIAMSLRHLRAVGWIVVEVRAKDFNAHTNLPAKVDFLKKRIENAIARS